MGCGPYGVSGGYYWELSEAGMYRHHNDEEHPDPTEDGIFAWDDGYVCGFTSLRSLHNWFKGYEDALSGLEFKVSVYDTDEEILEGRYQAMFNRDTAFLVTRYGLDRVRDKL